MKPDVVFGLDAAAWPALLVNGGGTILMANAAAKSLFGPAVGSGAAQLAALWPAENGISVTEFLSRWQPAAAPAVLKFRSPGGEPAIFLTACSAKVPPTANPACWTC